MSSENWDEDLQYLGLLHTLEMTEERIRKAQEEEQRARAEAERLQAETKRLRAEAKMLLSNTAEISRLAEAVKRRINESIVTLHNYGVSLSLLAECYEMTVDEIQDILSAASYVDDKNSAGSIDEVL